MNTTLSSHCLLDYAVTTFPYPLETGTPGTVDVTISNPDPAHPVSCLSIDIAFTAGLQVLDLADTNDATATPTLLGATSTHWKVTRVPVTGHPDGYRVTPASGSTESVAGTGLTLRLAGLPISDQKGSALLTVTETTGTAGTPATHVCVCRIDKHEHDLTPPTPVWATAQPVTDNTDPSTLPIVSHVIWNSPFTLLWSAYPRLNYKLVWNQGNQGEHVPDKDIHSWPEQGRPRFRYWSCPGITRTTTFQLVSTASGADSPLGALTVTVPNPTFATLAANAVTVGSESTLKKIDTPAVAVADTFTTAYLNVAAKMDTAKISGLNAKTSRTRTNPTVIQDPDHADHADCDIYDLWPATTLTVTGTEVQPSPVPPTPAIAVVDTKLVGRLTITAAGASHTFTVGPDQKPFTVPLPNKANTLTVGGEVRGLSEDDNYYPITGLKLVGNTIRLAKVKVKDKDKDKDVEVDATITEPISITFSAYPGASGYLDTPITPPCQTNDTETGTGK